MGDVVPLRRQDPVDMAYEAEVRELTALAGIADHAETYIRRRTPIADVLSDCIAAVFGKRLPRDAARRLSQLRGRVGTERRARPIHPEPHGIRRKPG